MCNGKCTDGTCQWCDMSLDDRNKYINDIHQENFNRNEEIMMKNYSVHHKNRIENDTKFYYEQNIKLGMPHDKALFKAALAAID